MKKLLTLIAFITMSIFSNEAIAQKGFSGSVVFGLNAAQIDGDALVGFNKLGLTGGFKLGYTLKEPIDINLEFLYSQRGSNQGFGFGSNTFGYTDLKYLELPITISYSDWKIEEGNYYKVAAHAGFSTSYLFDVSTNLGEFAGSLDLFESINMSLILGANYAFTKNLSLTVRYTRGLHSIYTTRAISYFWTVRTDYKF